MVNEARAAGKEGYRFFKSDPSRIATSDEMIDIWASWCEKYPIRSLEDGLGEDDGLVLFSDLSGGSCDVACRAGARAHERCVSISGVNLPMLLEFCHYRDRLALPALVGRILYKAQSGVRVCRRGEENGAPQPRADR